MPAFLCTTSVSSLEDQDLGLDLHKSCLRQATLGSFAEKDAHAPSVVELTLAQYPHLFQGRIKEWWDSSEDGLAQLYLNSQKWRLRQRKIPINTIECYFASSLQAWWFGHVIFVTQTWDGCCENREFPSFAISHQMICGIANSCWELRASRVQSQDFSSSSPFLGPDPWFPWSEERNTLR